MTRSGRGPRYDVDVPVLLLRSSPSAWDYGAVATIRTFGRVGIPVYAFVSDSEGPVRHSKYLTGRAGPCLDVAHGIARWVTDTNRAVSMIGRPTVAVACDDECAVFLAERRGDLDERLLTFPVRRDLPRRLASKSDLASLCQEAGVIYPRSSLVRDAAAARDFRESVGLPLVAKNPETFVRQERPAITRTTVLANGAQFEAALAQWDESSPLLLQEYLAHGASQELYVAGVIGLDGQPVVAFAGRKVAAYPADTGVGVVSYTDEAPALVAKTVRFAQDVGFVGAFDTDWHVTPGRDLLLDFNPRRGAQQALFCTDTGVDVARASHLVLTGRVRDVGRPLAGRRHQVGNLRLLGLAGGDRSVGLPWVSITPKQRRSNEAAWWAWDDPQPALRLAHMFVEKLLGRMRQRAV